MVTETVNVYGYISLVTCKTAKRQMIIKLQCENVQRIHNLNDM